MSQLCSPVELLYHSQLQPRFNKYLSNGPIMIRMLIYCIGMEFLLDVTHRPYALHLAALEPEGLKPTLCFQADNTLCCFSFNHLCRPRITIHITWKTNQNEPNFLLANCHIVLSGLPIVNRYKIQVLDGNIVSTLAVFPPKVRTFLLFNGSFSPLPLPGSILGLVPMMSRTKQHGQNCVHQLHCWAWFTALQMGSLSRKETSSSSGADSKWPKC